MRLRIAMLACAFMALASAAFVPAASAAPHHNRGLTIHAYPHQILAGDAVLIYGRLLGANHGGQTIRLYHRINPAQQFSLISTTTTAPSGLYEFTRAEGVVLTNRSWFVRGPGLTHSRTVHELVAPDITLSPSSTQGTTRHPIVFSGHLTPNHAGERVFLQQEIGTRDDWRTLKAGRLGPGSNYAIPYAWRVPGNHDVRVVFRGDDRNVRGASLPVTVVIQQAERADFTIASSAPIVPVGTAYNITGTLYKAGTTTPEPLTSVGLWAREPGQTPFKLVDTKSTDANGDYSFTEQSSTNELYQVRTTFSPARSSAVLFEGIQDRVTISASSSTSTVGGQVTFSGSVTPDKAGHVIYLQRRDPTDDGDWVTVETRYVGSHSTYQFGWTFGAAGTKQFRALITGGPVNVGAASPAATVVVSLPPVASLPSN